MPTPGVPTLSVTPVRSTAMTLVVAVRSAVGVSVAVQVIPPSAEATALSVPFTTAMSVLSKASTASEKVKVTRDVSPAVSAVSDTTMFTVGAAIGLSFLYSAYSRSERPMDRTRRASNEQLPSGRPGYGLQTSSHIPSGVVARPLKGEEVGASETACRRP